MLFEINLIIINKNLWFRDYFCLIDYNIADKSAPVFRCHDLAKVISDQYNARRIFRRISNNESNNKKNEDFFNIELLLKC